MPILIEKKDNPTSVGNRIKSARMLSGHSRISFSTISKISAATLRAWEEPNAGRYGLTEKGATRLINALRRCNINCTKKWLLHGIGGGPNLIGSNAKILDLQYENVNWGEEESILKDIAAFKSNNANTIVTMITDNVMLPFFSYGDYVGGCALSKKNIKKLIGFHCIIDIGNDLIVRTISACSKNRCKVTSPNPAFADSIINAAEIKVAAEIIWHRRRKLIL